MFENVERDDVNVQHTQCIKDEYLLCVYIRDENAMLYTYNFVVTYKSYNGYLTFFMGCFLAFTVQITMGM